MDDLSSPFATLTPDDVHQLHSSSSSLGLALHAYERDPSVQYETFPVRAIFLTGKPSFCPAHAGLDAASQSTWRLHAALARQMLQPLVAAYDAARAVAAAALRRGPPRRPPRRASPGPAPSTSWSWRSAGTRATRSCGCTACWPRSGPGARPRGVRVRSMPTKRKRHVLTGNSLRGDARPRVRVDDPRAPDGRAAPRRRRRPRRPRPRRRRAPRRARPPTTPTPRAPPRRRGAGRSPTSRRCCRPCATPWPPTPSGARTTTRTCSRARGGSRAPPPGPWRGRPPRSPPSVEERRRRRRPPESPPPRPRKPPMGPRARTADVAIAGAGAAALPPLIPVRAGAVARRQRLLGVVQRRGVEMALRERRMAEAAGGGAGKWTVPVGCRWAAAGLGVRPRSLTAP